MAMGLRYGKNPGRQARDGAGGAAMNATPLERLSDQLTRPRLLKRQERLEALLQEAAATDLSYADFLDQVLGEEVIAKAVKHGDADEFGPFPIVKSLEVFDFSYQPSLDKQLQQVAIYHFMEHGENVVLLGPPGVGKSHLAIGLGSTRSSGGLPPVVHGGRGHDRHAYPSADGESVGGQAETLHHPTIIDRRWVGYLPIDRTEANLFFQLISRRYEKGRMILASIQSFGA
jgi:DNA replication protein DnaC